MAKSQDNGNTIRLGLKGCEVEKAAEEKERIIAAESKDVNCPRSTSFPPFGVPIKAQLRSGHSLLWVNFPYPHYAKLSEISLKLLL